MSSKALVKPLPNAAYFILTFVIWIYTTQGSDTTTAGASPVPCGTGCICSYSKNTKDQSQDAITVTVRNCSTSLADWTDVQGVVDNNTVVHIDVMDSSFPGDLPFWICDQEHVLDVWITYSGLKSFKAYCLNKATNLRSLVLQNNAIEEVHSEIITKHLEELDLSHNKLATLPQNFWDSVETSNLRYVLLNNNLLKEVVGDSFPYQLPKIDNLTLHDNPIVCDCPQLALKKWININQDKVTSIQEIQCHFENSDPVPLVSLRDKDFQCPSKWGKADTMALILALFLVISLSCTILICCLLWYKRKHVYRKLHFHPFDNDECEGEDMNYDILLSYASDAEQWAEEQLLPFLIAKRFKVHYKNQRFTESYQHSANQPDALSVLEQSKRRVCIISNDFQTEEDCCAVLSASVELDRSLRHRRTILILFELDASISACLPASLQNVVKSYWPILRHERKFHHNLLYVLPRFKCRQRKENGLDVEVPEDIPLA